MNNKAKTHTHTHKKVTEWSVCLLYDVIKTQWWWGRWNGKCAHYKEFPDCELLLEDIIQSIGTTIVNGSTIICQCSKIFNHHLCYNLPNSPKLPLFAEPVPCSPSPRDPSACTTRLPSRTPRIPRSRMRRPADPRAQPAHYPWCNQQRCRCKYHFWRGTEMSGGIKAFNCHDERERKKKKKSFEERKKGPTDSMMHSVPENIAPTTAKFLAML